MPFVYDVFLSYSHHGEWPDWVRKKFLPLLRHWLGEELGREANVFSIRRWKPARRGRTGSDKR